jgi:glycerol-3-phosphate cytidylyltransferase
MKSGVIASAFDLLHAGHCVMLKNARSYCDHLTVLLHTDPSKERENKNTPSQSTTERFIQLESCKYVDYIIPYDTENDLVNILSSYSFDVRFLGEEYQNQPITGEHLVPICFLSRKHNWSSSELRERIKTS